jgi:hypothetical protein
MHNGLIDENRPISAGYYARRWDLDNDNGKRVKKGFYRVKFYVGGDLICHGDIQVN